MNLVFCKLKLYLWFIVPIRTFFYVLILFLYRIRSYDLKNIFPFSILAFRSSEWSSSSMDDQNDKQTLVWTLILRRIKKYKLSDNLKVSGLLLESKCFLIYELSFSLTLVITLLYKYKIHILS